MTMLDISIIWPAYPLLNSLQYKLSGTTPYKEYFTRRPSFEAKR